MIMLKEVPISSLVLGTRFREDYGDIDMLVESMKQEGIIQPLAVRENGDGTYALLAGGRRYTAATKAGIETVPVRCYPATLSELEMRSIELMENVCRKDLEWHEAAKLKKEILKLQEAIYGKKESTSPDAPGVSLRDVAKMLGLSPATLSQDVSLANALEAFPELATKAKNKNEANKIIGKMQENLVRSEIARRIEEKALASPIEHVRNRLINNFIIGDFFSGVKKMPNNSVDFVELDPPYAIDLTNIKRDMKDKMESYNEMDSASYSFMVMEMLSQLYRVMSANSWLVMWHAREWLPEIIKIANQSGLVCSYNTVGIWYKGSSGQTNVPALYLASSYEQFVYMRKGEPSIVRQGRSNVFSYKPVSANKKIHPTERPVEMIQDIMQTFCWEGARCLIPFLGSGNSILAASNLNIQAFGWELSEEYRNGYIIRVTESKPTAYHSYKEGVEND